MHIHTQALVRHTRTHTRTDGRTDERTDERTSTIKQSRRGIEQASRSHLDGRLCRFERSRVIIAAIHGDGREAVEGHDEGASFVHVAVVLVHALRLEIRGMKEDRWKMEWKQ